MLSFHEKWGSCGSEVSIWSSGPWRSVDVQVDPNVWVKIVWYLPSRPHEVSRRQNIDIFSSVKTSYVVEILSVPSFVIQSSYEHSVWKIVIKCLFTFVTLRFLDLCARVRSLSRTTMSIWDLYNTTNKCRVLFFNVKISREKM